MADKQEVFTGISLEKQKIEAKNSGRAAAICLLILVAVWAIGTRWAVYFGIGAVFGLPVFGAQFVFHGATVIALTLRGPSRQRFQLGISIIVPLVLSLYFIYRVSDPTFHNVFGPSLTVWILFPICLIGCISFCVGETLDSELPFRGFLIAAVVLFGFSLLGYYKASLGADRGATLSGHHFGAYLINVTISYLALLLRIFWPRLRSLFRRRGAGPAFTMEEGKQAEALVRAYGRIVTEVSAAPGVGMLYPESALPATKDHIKLALRLVGLIRAVMGDLESNITLNTGTTFTTRDALTINYANLAFFVPDNVARHDEYVKTLANNGGDPRPLASNIDAILAKLNGAEHLYEEYTKCNAEYDRLMDEYQNYLKTCEAETEKVRRSEVPDMSRMLL